MPLAGYTGVAIDKNATSTYLLAANFNAGTIDVFDNSFHPAQLAGAFKDPALPAGYSPFSVHVIGSSVYVAYAQIASKKQVVGAGLGFVDVYDLNGNLVKEAIQQSVLNAPWGVTVAPAGFGSFAGDLLVGNFGDGQINAFDPTTFAYKGTLGNAQGQPIVNPGLWEIVFGTGTLGDPNTLYFAAGINGGKGGVFGSVSLISGGAGSPSVALQSSAPALTVSSGASGTATISMVAQNGFDGPVTLSCSGLPANSACTFSPASVTVSGSTVVTSTLTITENGTAIAHVEQGRSNLAGMSLAIVSPFALLLVIGTRERATKIRLLLMVAAVGSLSLLAVGCSDSHSSGTTTATGTTMTVMVNASSGSVTSTVPLTVTFR